MATHPQFAEHATGAGHPERPARLDAVLAGVADVDLDSDLVVVTPREATRDDLALVHDRAHVAGLERFCAEGGGFIDGDTTASSGSWSAALLAAGAGLDVIDRLAAGDADAGFCAVRPPGHHATRDRAMGFCLFNNVAVAAAALVARGERVLVLDIDAHHGNGTQDIFWDDPHVLYVSLHEHPLYPGTGALDETGGPAAPGTTVNIPLPAGATGDVYIAAYDRVVAPAVDRFAPTWLVLSAGFDAHRRDPLTGLALSAGDYADLTARAIEAAPPGRRIAFLEGGYDLDGLRSSTAATLGALTGHALRPETATSGGPGGHVVDAAAQAQETHS